MNFALILLAAGASRRLGSPKQLIQFRGKTLLRHAVETALQTASRPIIVVLGDQHDRMQEELSGADISIVLNPLWEEGIASSIRAGIEAVGDVEGVTLLLCDQPFISATFLEKLRTTGKLAAAEYGGSIGVPAFFPREFFPELAELKGNEGAKKILQRHAAKAIPCPEALIDIDTPEAVKALQ